MVDGAVKVKPSEELLSMPVEKQISTLENNIQTYTAKLKTIDDSDKCEIELTLVILKNFLKQFRDANWVRINQ